MIYYVVENWRRGWWVDGRAPWSGAFSVAETTGRATACQPAIYDRRWVFLVCNNAKSREYFSSYLTRDRIGQNEKSLGRNLQRISPPLRSLCQGGVEAQKQPIQWKVNCTWNEHEHSCMYVCVVVRIFSQEIACIEANWEKVEQEGWVVPYAVVIAALSIELFRFL